MCYMTVAAVSLVKHSSHSHPATVALKAEQAQTQPTQHTLIQKHDGTVRDMCKRLLEQRWAVTVVLSDRTVTRLQDTMTLELQDDCWQIMTELSPVFTARKCAKKKTSPTPTPSPSACWRNTSSTQRMTTRMCQSSCVKFRSSSGSTCGHLTNLL